MRHCANDACPDLARRGRRGEFLDSVVRCPHCGEPLRTGEAPPRGVETRWADSVCIASFISPPQAYVARAKLEALGIPATIHDQYFVVANWLQSRGIGGVKVFVPPEHAAAASAALQRDDSEALADLPESSLPPARDERCPKCGALAALGAARSHRWRAVSLLIGFPLPFTRPWLRCSACGHEWRPPKAPSG